MLGFPVNDFPFSDSHSLNLDWILNQVKTIISQCATIQDAINALDTWCRGEGMSENVQSAMNVWKNDGTLQSMIDAFFGEHQLIKYDTFADLKNSLPVIGKVYATTGFYTIGDGGNALYECKSSGTDDGLTQIKCVNNAYLMLRSTQPNVRQFGAVGDGLADDTNAFKKALAYIGQRDVWTAPMTSEYYGNGGTLFVPHGLYLITSTLYLDANTKMVGENSPVSINPQNDNYYNAKTRTILFYNPTNANSACIETLPFVSSTGARYTLAYDAIISQTETQFMLPMNVTIKDLTIKCNSKIGIKMSYSPSSKLENVGVHAAEVGIAIFDCWNSVARDCQITANRQGVVLINACNNFKLENCYVNSNNDGYTGDLLYTTSYDLNKTTTSCWCTGIYIHSDNVIIDNCICEHWDRAIFAWWSNTLKITHLYVEDIKQICCDFDGVQVELDGLYSNIGALPYYFNFREENASMVKLKGILINTTSKQLFNTRNSCALFSIIVEDYVPTVSSDSSSFSTTFVLNNNPKQRMIVVGTTDASGNLKINFPKAFPTTSYFPYFQGSATAPDAHANISAYDASSITLKFYSIVNNTVLANTAVNGFLTVEFAAN